MTNKYTEEYTSEAVIQTIKNLMIDENLTVEEASKRITLVCENGLEINLGEYHLERLMEY